MVSGFTKSRLDLVNDRDEYRTRGALVQPESVAQPMKPAPPIVKDACHLVAGRCTHASLLSIPSNVAPSCVTRTSTAVVTEPSIHTERNLHLLRDRAAAYLSLRAAADRRRRRPATAFARDLLSLMSAA